MSSGDWTLCLRHEAIFVGVDIALGCPLPLPIEVVAHSVSLLELILGLKGLVVLKPLLIVPFLVIARQREVGPFETSGIHSCFFGAFVSTLRLVELRLHLRLSAYLIHHCIESIDLLLEDWVFRAEYLSALQCGCLLEGCSRYFRVYEFIMCLDSSD